METIIEITPVMIGVIAIVMGLTQVVKPFVSDNRFHPVISLGFATLCSFLVHQETIAMTIIAGLIMGLAASGLYSTTKTFAQKE